MIKKRGQEEMIGFALIIILVAVILLAFLGFSLNKPQKTAIKSYEVENFIQAFLQYTTDCEGTRGSSIQDLVFDCYSGNKCSDNRNTCEVLNITLKGILNESWQVEEGSVYKGYELTIDTDDEENPRILSIERGNSSRSYKAGFQQFSKTRPKRDFVISFKAYS